MRYLILLALVGCTFPASDPSPDAGPVVQRSCTNEQVVLNADGTETLVVAFNCGSFSAGPALAILIGDGQRLAVDYTFVCGNNEFPRFAAKQVVLDTQITGQDFDMTCGQR